MATLKPISTISYNTESFLKDKLDSWLDSHIIQAYQYIKHKGEDGDKDHIHLRLEPNKKLDPMDLLESLREYQFGKPKPLGCRPFRPSKEEDWILYAVHDEQYLKLKYGGGEKGEKLPYNWQEIVVPEYYDMEIAYIRAKAYLEHTSVNMATRLMNGVSPLNLVLQGENVHTVNALMRAISVNDYNRLFQDYIKLKSEFDSISEWIHGEGFSFEFDSDGNLSVFPVRSHE